MSFLIYRQRATKKQNTVDYIHDGQTDNNIQLTNPSGEQYYKNGLTNEDVDNNFYTLNIEKLDKLTLPNQSVNSSVYFKQHVNTNTLNIQAPTFTINDNKNIQDITIKLDQGILMQSSAIEISLNNAVLFINETGHLVINVNYLDVKQEVFVGNDTTKTVIPFVGNNIKIFGAATSSLNNIWKITAINIVNNNIEFTTDCTPIGGANLTYNSITNPIQLIYSRNVFYGYKANTNQMTYLIQSNINNNTITGIKGTIDAYVENDNIINKPAYWARTFAFMG